MRYTLRALALFSLTLAAVQSSLAGDNPRKADEYGAINCEDEMARLDNYAIELQNDPSAQAVVIVYGGRRGTRRDEVGARMAYVKYYLAVRRGIDRGHILVFNGGYRESLTTELYVIPAGAEAKFLIAPTVSPKEVRFRGGKVGSRIRACGGIG